MAVVRRGRFAATLENGAPIESDGSTVWAPDGTILFTQFRDGLYRIDPNGGPARCALTQLDKIGARDESLLAELPA